LGTEQTFKFTQAKYVIRKGLSKHLSQQSSRTEQVFEFSKIEYNIQDLANTSTGSEQAFKFSKTKYNIQD